jgi:short-subunit dehydrogenase
VSALAPKEIGTILITGCSTGIGRALTVEFARRGYRVLATARRLETIADLASTTVDIAELDVTDSASIERLGISEREIGMLVNNAGFGLVCPMLDLELDAMRGQYETNVFGVLAMVKAVAPQMIARRRGRIVNISSVSGVLTTPLAGAYCSSKAAVNSMSDAMRMDFAPFGVEVITVQPGAIKSSFGETATSMIVDLSKSVYAPIARTVERRAVSGQVDGMPAETFARLAIDALVKEKPPTLVRVGPLSYWLPFYKRWSPPRFLDRQLSRRFRLARLAKKP